MNHRLKNHGVLALISVICFGRAAAAGPAGAELDNFSIVSAYLCLLLLVVVLLIGPWYVAVNGRASANIYLRRDIGIWAALSGLVHFFLANVLAMNYEYLGIFVENAAAPPSAEVRGELYAWGTISGYVVAVFFLVLLGLSSDRTLRFIGLKWWKRIQRISYVVFILTCAHGFAFQVLESREMFWIAAVGCVILVALTGQMYGIAAVRQRRAGKPGKVMGIY